jgi:hypothetical protein
MAMQENLNCGQQRVKNNDEYINSRSKFKWWSENITAGETRQCNLSDRAEGLIT